METISELCDFQVSSVQSGYSPVDMVGGLVHAGIAKPQALLSLVQNRHSLPTAEYVQDFWFLLA